MRKAAARAPSTTTAKPQAVRRAKQIEPPRRQRLSEHERFKRGLAATRELEKRAKAFARVKAQAKPRKSDPPIVFIAAKTGKRVPRGYKGQVFAFYHSKPSQKHPKGRLVAYSEHRERKRLKALGLAPGKVVPRPVKVRWIDPKEFKAKRAQKFYYGTVSKLTRFKTTVTRPRGIDFMDRVVPAVAQTLQDAANQFEERRQFKLDCSAVVKLPDGNAKAFVFDVDFRQADLQQFMDLGFYEPFVEQKLYAEFAEQLKGFGLVTTGSAQFISALPINAGKPREEWRDKKGMLWKHGQGWKLKEVELVRFDATPGYVQIT